MSQNNIIALVARAFSGGAALLNLDSAGNLRTVANAALLPTSTLAAGVVYDAHLYGGVRLQINGLSGGDTIAFTWSIDGMQPYIPINWTDLGFALGTGPTFPISANGGYNFKSGFLKWAQTGSASTPTVIAGASS